MEGYLLGILVPAYGLLMLINKVVYGQAGIALHSYYMYVDVNLLHHLNYPFRGEIFG